MKLHEALAQLKEDGSNWIAWDGNKIMLKDGFYEFYEINTSHHGDLWKNEPEHIVEARDNWQLYQEPKFKEGDLVKDRTSGIYDRISEIFANGYFLGEEELGVLYKESDLILILPSKQISKILDQGGHK